MIQNDRVGNGRAVAITALIAAAVAMVWWLWREAPTAVAAVREVREAARPMARPTERPSVRADFAAELETLHIPTASIAGTVRARRDGRPIAGAWVCAWSQSMEPGERGEPPRCATSERDGHYRITELPPLGFRVSASAPRFVPGQYQRGSFIDGVVQLRPNSERNDLEGVPQRSGAKPSFDPLL